MSLAQQLHALLTLEIPIMTGETIVTTRPYVEHPLHVEVTTPDGSESDLHVMTATADGLVRLELAGLDDAWGGTPAEARAIAAGLLEVAGEAEERAAAIAPPPVVDPVSLMTVAELKLKCSDMEQRLGGRDCPDVIGLRARLEIPVAIDIQRTRIKQPGALRYLRALEVQATTTPMRLPSGCAQADIDVGEQPEDPQP